MSTHDPSISPVSTTVDPEEAARWSPVIGIAAGIAMLVGSEFLPAGVLPTLAADLRVSEGVAGLAVAATAIAGALTAPTIAVLLPRADRRHVLVGLLLTAAVANLLVAIAPSFAVLLAGRLVLGMALAGYWAFAFVAGTYAVPGRDHVVSSAMAFGVAVATVVGIPVASLIGDQVGWRAAFGGAAVLTAITALSLSRVLPSVPAHPAAGLRMLRQALGRARLMGGLGCVVLVAFGNFAAYPYIRLATERVVEPDQSMWFLLAWGLGGLVGSLLAGALAVRLRMLAAGAPLLLAAGLVVTITAGTAPALAIGVVVWGLAFNMVPVATQLWVTRVEPDRAESAMSLQVTAFQVAITLGSAVGGVLLDRHGIALPYVVGVAAAIAAGVGFGSLRVQRH